MEPKAPSWWTFLMFWKYCSKSRGLGSFFSSVAKSFREPDSMASSWASVSGSARGLSAFGGSEMKKVSWTSRAGCCWGTKRASKFQKPESTKLRRDVVSPLFSRKRYNGVVVLLARRHLNEALTEENVPELLADLV